MKETKFSNNMSYYCYHLKCINIMYIGYRDGVGGVRAEEETIKRRSGHFTFIRFIQQTLPVLKGILWMTCRVCAVDAP